MSVIREKRGLRVPGKFELYWNKWSLAFEIIFCGRDENRWPWMLHVHLLLLGAFVHFPCPFTPSSKRESYMREWQRWGFSFCDDSLHLHWNEKTKVWFLPFKSFIHMRHEVRRSDGSWVPYVGSWERDKQPDGREEAAFPYHYTLNNGQVQERTATVFVGRMAWRPKWLAWTSLFERERQSIDVAFSDEVGERTGSWKGGTVGCGYDMLPNETPEQTLRRMERERRFR
jgi:hypothetical protein